jgi:hypothetical protein
LRKADQDKMDVIKEEIKEDTKLGATNESA